MDAAMWVSKTGLDAQQMRMNVISNNLANVNTTGFKNDRAVFQDLLYQNVRQAGGQTTTNTQSPTGLMVGTGVKVMATEKLHTQGNMINTNNSLDMAIQGSGFFQITQPWPTQGMAASSSPTQANSSRPLVYRSHQLW
jgi:flagellar basal-body rod protein FlgG